VQGLTDAAMFIAMKQFQLGKSYTQARAHFEGEFSSSYQYDYGNAGKCLGPPYPGCFGGEDKPVAPEMTLHTPPLIPELIRRFSCQSDFETANGPHNKPCALL
jgi:hypothetical protein